MEANKECELKHGDNLCFGKAIFLLIHIHEGSNTCINCEPGEVMHKLKLEKEILTLNEEKLSYDREEIRKQNVKLIKSK